MAEKEYFFINSKIIRCLLGCGAACTGLGECKMAQPLWETIQELTFIFSVQPMNSTPREVLNKNKNTCSCENLHAYV